MKKNLLTNLTYTFLSQIISAVFLVILLRVAATTLPKEEFGLFIVIRRLISIGFPIISLKLGISLSRYGHEETNQYLCKSIQILIITHTLLFICSVFFSKQLSHLVFGRSGYSELIFISVLYVFSYSFHSLLHGYFRGKLVFSTMNVIVIVFNATALIGAIFFISRNSIFNYYLFISISNILICIYIFIIFIKKKNHYKEQFNWRFTNIKPFIMYGVSRLPSGFFFSGLLFFPVFIATHWISIEAAGLIGIIIAVISLVQIMTMPIGTLFLPIFAHLKKGNNINKLKEKTQDILDFVFTIPFIFGCLLLLFSNELVFLWFGPTYTSITNEIRLLSVGVGFIIIFILLRSVIDGISNVPYVNIITFISLIVFLLGIGLVGEHEISIRKIVIIFSLSISVLGLISIYILHLISTVNVLTKRNIIAVLWILFNYIAVYYLTEIISVQLHLVVLLIKLTYLFITLTLSYYLYRYLGYNWIKYLEDRLLKTP